MRPDSPQNPNQRSHLQVNITEEHKCKHLQHSQQNISKPNPTTHKKDHTPWTGWIYPWLTDGSTYVKSINVIHHINKRKDKSHDYLNRYRKSIWWNPTLFHDKNKNKTISKQGTEGTFLDLTYSIYEKPTANSIPRTYWGKTESFLPKNMNKTRMLALTVSIQHYTGGSSQKFDFSKNHWGFCIGKEKVKLSLYENYINFYTENAKQPTK